MGILSYSVQILKGFLPLMEALRFLANVSEWH